MSHLKVESTQPGWRKSISGGFLVEEEILLKAVDGDQAGLETRTVILVEKKRAEKDEAWNRAGSTGERGKEVKLRSRVG